MNGKLWNVACHALPKDTSSYHLAKNAIQCDAMSPASGEMGPKWRHFVPALVMQELVHHAQ
jgi:hypothetical protein